MPGSPYFRRAADPDRAAKRLIREVHNSDGLPEIFVGLTFLLVAGLVYAHVVLPRDSAASKAAVIAFAFLLPVLCLGTPWALRQIRARYLIAKTGYVRANPLRRKQIVAGVVLGVATLALLAVTVRVSQPDRWLLAGTGLFGGALAAWAGRLPRFLIGGGLMAATGVLLAFSGIRLEAGFSILFGSLGLLALISGALVLLRFMRQPAGAGE